MAVIDTFGTVQTEAHSAAINPFSSLARAIRFTIDHHREHRLIARLSRLPDHVVRDMGFDPDKVASTLSGSWDDVTLPQIRH